MIEGRKDDSQKWRFDLLPPLALTELARVYTFGAAKYAPRNWELGMSWCRIFAAIMRHSFKWFCGQTHDNETGLHHMAHAAFGCLALVEYSFTLKGVDDRPYIEEFEIQRNVLGMFAAMENSEQIQGEDDDGFDELFAAQD